MEEFREIIAEVEAKIQKMNTSLHQIDAVNKALNKELEVMSEKLSRREVEVSDFKTKYDAVKHQLEVLQSEVEKKQEIKETQIDDLVREIDDCISRLKSS